MKKRLVSLISALSLLISGPVFGQCPLEFKGNDAALIGVYIAPVRGGVCLEYNADRQFLPASVMKVVTSAAAISRYGGEYRWTTDVKSVGRLSGGVLSGNILVEGSGDPTLGSVQFKDTLPGFISSVRDAVRRAGITTVEGTVTTAAPWPDQGPVMTWELEDIPGVDGAGFYALNYMDNVFTLSVPSMKATPAIPGLKVRNEMGGSGGVRFTRYPGSNEIVVRGSLGRKQKRASLRCSMPDPTLVLVSRLDSALECRNRRDLTVAADTAMILSYSSPLLRDVCRSLMVRSDNQMAEATLRLLAPRGSLAGALKAERDILTGLGVDMRNARLADGSGLSRHNCISPRQLGRILAVMAHNADYLGTFARVGLDGTVRNFMKKMPRRTEFILKSGSMTGVVCYAGYRLDPETKAPTHVLVAMVNNAPVASDARTAIASFFGSYNY